MEHLQAVQARIADIRGIVESARPDTAGSATFRAALAKAVGAGDATAAPEGPAQTTGTMALSSIRGGLLPPGVFSPPPSAVSGGLAAPVDARVSSRFGPRVHPVTGQRHQHSGVDFAAPAGTPVRAAAAGRVTFAGTRGAYGNLVIVAHPDGTETWYAHQRDLAVRAGQEVASGSVLGTVGSTGRSTGPHLHLELRRGGVPVDPLPLLGRRGVGGHGHAHG
jgi:murein DD-endopeptidase MepM/ murein hydrolase activator NlpD